MGRVGKVAWLAVMVGVALALPLWAKIQTNRNLFSSGIPPLTIPWDAPFPDTNYTAVCSAEVGLQTPFLLPVITSRSAGSITVVPTDRDPAGILDCIAVSDTDNTANLRHGRQAFSGNPATITVNWNTAFADTNYTPVCTVETADPNDVSFLSVINAGTPSSITITNSGIKAGTVHCLGMPFSDPGQVIHQGFTSFNDNPSAVTINWQASFDSFEGYASTCSDIALGGGNTSVAIETNSQTPTQITAIPQLAQGSTACLAALTSRFATSMALSVNPPSPAPGEVVTLTAIATGELEGHPTGTVVFLKGKQVIGTSQLVDLAQATATLKARFGPGSYSLTALYTGTRNPGASFSPSQSSPQLIQVNGTTSTQSTLTATPHGRNYDFDLSVFGFGFPPLAGSAVVNNLTQNTVVGDITVAGPGLSSLLAPKFASLNLAEPSGMVVADFNQDGFPDVAVSDGSNNRVLILLGNGDGTFKPFTTTQVGNDPIGIVVGDFNNDGIPDLAVTNVGDGTVSVLLGKGDGTFTVGTTFSAGAAKLITVGDFDRDGNLDLAVTETGNFQLRIFLGQGSGQFTQVQQVSIVGRPNAIIAGDFNMDGAPDIALVYPGNSNTLLVLLGHGDGTFNAQNPTFAGPEASRVAVGDFNGDNIPDLAVSNQTGNGSVTVLLGDGKGNFTLKSAPAVGALPLGIQVTDMNGDGIADLVVANQIDETMSVLLGKGDGSFQTQQTFAVTVMPLALAVADFSGDGVPDPATVNFSGSGSVAVLLGGTLSTGSVSDLPVVGIGPQNVQSTFTPTGTFFSGSDSSVLSLQGSGQVPTTTAVFSSLNPSMYLQPVTFTATVTGNGGTPTGTVTFTDASNNNAVLCNQVALNADAVATCPNITSLAVGSDVIEASYSGDNNFNPSVGDLKPSQQVNKAGVLVQMTSTPNPSTYFQVVTITATVTGNFGGSPSGTVDFTADNNVICSAVPLTLSRTTSTATCSISTLAPGSHSVVASYSGNATFLGSQSAPLVQVVNQVGSFNVQPISPSSLNLTQGFNNLNQPFFAQPINVSVHANSGYQGTVMLTCSVSPPLSAGSCVVNAPNSGSLANSDLHTTITINTADATPIGGYTVTVTAEDTNHTKQSSMLALTVINNAPVVMMPSGGAGRTPVIFPGAPNTPVSNFGCTSVTGEGITGSEDLSKIGGNCGFTPGSITLPDPVTVTISGCVVVSRMNRHAPIFASFVFGMPALVLLGPLCMARGRRKNVLRVLALFLVATVLLLSFACGGGSSSGGSGQFVPNAHYYVLVQGTGVDGATYSAVVPVTVTGTSR